MTLSKQLKEAKGREMNYDLNRHYFSGSKKPSVKGILLLSLVILVLLSFAPTLAFVLLGICLVGACILYKRKPTDAEIDEQAAAFLAGIRPRALMKLGVEEEEVALATPIEFWGYSFDNVLSDDANREAFNIRGKDAKWRSSEISVGGFYFSEDVVHHYYKIASLVSDATREGTEEYFYKDIVSVKTESGDRAYKNPKTGKEDQTQRVRYEGFTLRNTGGESTCCWVNDIETAEAAVTAFRSLLKQKKMA